MPPDTLIIRADSSVAMGTGHVMRSLALAQAWQDQSGDCLFAMAEASPSLKERVSLERIGVDMISAPAGSREDAEQLLELAEKHQARWLVVDGYQFDVEYQRVLKAGGLKILMVDDTAHAGAYVADLVLDQNAHASEIIYQRREAYTRLLLGPRYAMLRREFKAWRKWKREISPVVRKVLVTIGGSDPDNVVARVIGALGLLEEENLQATIVLGGSNPHSGQEEEIRQAGISAVLLRNVTNMPELMADADVAISAAGSTCWEMCFMGLPAVLIDVAENQVPVARELDRRGVAIHLGGVKDASPENIAAKLKLMLDSQERRVKMSLTGQALVDGKGSDRVLAAMRVETLRLRSAGVTDCELLWEWVNDSATRAASFASDPIPWERHQAWFEDKMKDPGCLILIAENAEGKPVGQIRLESRAGLEREIDVSVAPDSRGFGLGSQLIDMATSEVFLKTDTQAVHAFVRPENRASIRAFERANFVKLGDEVVGSFPALHYRRLRNPTSE